MSDLCHHDWSRVGAEPPSPDPSPPVEHSEEPITHVTGPHQN